MQFAWNISCLLWHFPNLPVRLSLVNKPTLVITMMGLCTALSVSTTAQSPQSSQRKDIPTIAREAEKSVVSVVVRDKRNREIAQGTGFFVTGDGRAVTNYHVIRDGASAIVKFSEGAFFEVEGISAFDVDRDLAILKVIGRHFSPVQLGDSEKVRVGEEVIAIGNPLSLEMTVSSGIVSAIRTADSENRTFIQTTSPISPGSSGGPLFNSKGQVVGITTAYVRGGQNLNFAIPINDLKPLLMMKTSELYGFPDEVKQQRGSAKPATRMIQRPSLSGNWKNLKDGQIYQLREINQRLYFETLPTSRVSISCEFKHATTPGMVWIGTCYQRDESTRGAKELSTYLSDVSNERIEGNGFILIPAD